MNPFHTSGTFLGTVLLIGLLVGCKGETQNTQGPVDPVEATATPQSNKGQAFIQDDESQPNVLQIALGSPDHSTLVAAVRAAGLENALVNAGPLMVFAPTDQAFAALPEGTVAQWMIPEKKQDLANILQYHVTAGNYSKEFLKKFKKLGQANNRSVAVELRDGEVYIGEAKIIASIPAGNGIVHVVDKVLLPPAE